MHTVVHGRMLGVAAVLAILAGAPASAQRAGDSGWAVDSKSGQFGTVFSTEPAHPPDTDATTEAPNAERYTVQLTLLAAVHAVDAAHTEVHTRVEANASPNGLSTVVKCLPTGRLEDRFAEQLKKELGL